MLALVWLAVAPEPSVERTVALTPAQVARAKDIVTGRYRSAARYAELATITVRPDDADLAANYLVNRFLGGSASLVLEDGAARFAGSMPVRLGPFVRHLNVEAYAVESTNLPLLRAVRIGRVPVPDAVSEKLVDWTLAWLRRNPDYRAGLDAVQRLRFFRWGLVTVYTWEPGLSKRVRASAFDAAERERLRAYQTRLAEIVRDEVPGAPSLTRLLPPLMAHAVTRSATGDPVEENRSALLALAIYVVGKRPDMLIPEAATWPVAPRRRVLLAGRDDFPKHFMVSAALAAYAGTVVSDAIGLYKELEDARRGSGFSFNDIAADRAGTRFGQLAVATETSARDFGRRVAAGLAESDIMPPVADLPEFMSQPEFQARFGGVGAPPYRRMMADIESRISALPMFR